MFGEPEKVLIIDDLKDNLRLLTSILDSQNYQILTAQNGITGIAIAQQQIPDLILLDLLMPEMNGLEICQILKQDQVTRDIPIIFISALSTISEKIEAFSVGAVDYISKPFDLGEVLARVETHLRLRRLQQQLEQKTIALEAALAQEQELSQMKSNFISVVSHEFRTPLTAIQSSVELLKYYEWSREEQVEQLQQILSQVDYMKILMTDVLNLNNQGESFVPESTAIVEFWHSLVLEIIYRYRKSHSIDLVNKYPASLSAAVMLDQKLVRLIMNNLITNAVKYSPPDSLLICSLAVMGEWIVMTVKDFGIGIPLADQAQVFRRFYRGQNVSDFPGTGLGLAIVAQCVDLHRGKIELHSQLGQGTTFELYLPLVIDQTAVPKSRLAL